MSLSSSVGLMSGINYDDIIAQMTAVNARPINLLYSQKAEVEVERAALQEIDKALAEFRSAAEALKSRDAFFSYRASVTDSSVLSATVSGSPQPSRHSLEVRQLATSHRIASQGVASLDASIASAAGTFSFALGDGATVSIDVDAGTSLQELVDLINAESGSKVTASIINDGTDSNPHRLVLTSDETGAANRITILNNDTTLELGATTIEAATASTANQFDGTITSSGTYTGTTTRNILMRITEAGDVGTAKFQVSLDGGVTWEADQLTTSATPVDVTGALGEGVMVDFAAGAEGFAVGDEFAVDAFAPELQAARDAVFVLDGIQLKRSSNTVDDAIDGLSLTLKTVDSEAVSLDITNSLSSIESKVQDFVSAYNATMAEIEKQSGYDVDEEEAGPLFGDGSVNSLTNSLRSQMFATIDGLGAYNTLSAIGIEVQESGDLSVDSTKLQKALENDIDAVANLFVRGGVSTSSLVAVADGSEAETGTYGIDVTQAATQAAVTGGRALEPAGLTADERLTIVWNTDEVVVVDLTAGQTLSSIISTLNATFEDKNMDIVASEDNGALRINSSTYGDEESLSVYSNRGAAEAGQLGIGTTALQSTGLNVIARVNGVEIEGSGRTLKHGSGLELTITATEPVYSTVTVSQGIASAMLGEIDNATDSETGVFTTKDASYVSTLEDYDRQINELSERLELEEERMRAQFVALEQKLAALQSDADFVSTQLTALM